MVKKAIVDPDDHMQLLRYLLVLELWRSGLSQSEIRARLGMSMNMVNAMLKGISRTASSDRD